MQSHWRFQLSTDEQNKTTSYILVNHTMWHLFTCEGCVFLLTICSCIFNVQQLRFVTLKILYLFTGCTLACRMTVVPISVVWPNVLIATGNSSVHRSSTRWIHWWIKQCNRWINRWINNGLTQVWCIAEINRWIKQHTSMAFKICLSMQEKHVTSTEIQGTSAYRHTATCTNTSSTSLSLSRHNDACYLCNITWQQDQLSQRDRAMLRVIELSLKLIWNDTVE